MEYLEAKKVLKLHSGWSEETEEVKDGIYLIASLRIFEGEIVGVKEFQEIKDAVYTVYKKFKGQGQIDREIMKYINGITGGSVYALALGEKSPLRRNNLISEATTKCIKEMDN